MHLHAAHDALESTGAGAAQSSEFAGQGSWRVSVEVVLGALVEDVNLDVDVVVAEEVAARLVVRQVDVDGVTRASRRWLPVHNKKRAEGLGGWHRESENS